MAHYAFIKDNIVTEVIVGKDEDDTDTLPDGFADWEAYYLSKRSDQDACKRTSYNTYANEHKFGGTAFRGNFAGIGYIYDETNNVFYAEQPFPSWSISADTNWLWEAPLPYPLVEDDETRYTWNEEAYQADNTTGWDLIQ